MLEEMSEDPAKTGPAVSHHSNLTVVEETDFDVHVSMIVDPKPRTILPAMTTANESTLDPAALMTAPMKMKIEQMSEPLDTLR